MDEDVTTWSRVGWASVEFCLLEADRHFQAGWIDRSRCLFVAPWRVIILHGLFRINEFIFFGDGAGESGKTTLGPHTMTKIPMDSHPAHPYGRDPPQEILDMIQDLHTCELEISFAEQRLQALREQQRKLRNDLATFRASVAPIARIPIEILCLILSAVVGMGDYSQILSLSLVCHNWRRVVMSTPQMWVTLPVSLVNDMNHMVKQQRLIETVLERSSGQKLHVSIDLTYFEPLQEYISSRIEDAFPSFYESSEIVDWVSASDWTTLSVVDAIKDYQRRLFDTLIGLEREHIALWGSLTLTLPWEEGSFEQVVPFLDIIFEGKPSNLLELEINGHPPGSEETDSRELHMPPFESLEHLKCSGQLDLSNLDISPSLRSLDCVDTVIYRNLPHIHKFRDLHTLAYKVYSLMIPLVDLERILLPQLQKLFLSGSPHREVMDLFEAPALLVLSVTLHKECYVDGVVPQSGVFAGPPAVIIRGDDSHSMNKGILHSFVKQCKSAREIVVEEDWKEQVAETIVEYRLENPGELAQLQRIYGCDELGDVLGDFIDVSLKPP